MALTDKQLIPVLKLKREELEKARKPLTAKYHAAKSKLRSMENKIEAINQAIYHLGYKKKPAKSEEEEGF